MLHPSTQQLIRKLCELTQSGAIEWKEGDDQRSIFETEGYVVEIQADPPGVRLLRADGHELESANAEDLAAPWDENEGTYGTHVADMARRANRVARGAETAIAKILSSLSAPPRKQPEPEPEPAALAFADVTHKTVQSVRASESAAAIAAVSADLESQRRKAAEDPPVSHELPEAPIMVIAPETETAIDRVLAVQPTVRPEPKEEPAPPPSPASITAPVAEAPQPPRPTPEIKAEPPAPPKPRAIDLPPPFADSTMQPQLERATIPAAVVPPAQPAPAPAPAPAPIQHLAPTLSAKPGFGSISGFSRTQPEAPATPAPEVEARIEPAKITSAGLLVSGISARSRQTVEASSSKDFYRPIAPQPAPAQAQAAQAITAPEKKIEPAIRAGADIYKPWA